MDVFELPNNFNVCSLLSGFLNFSKTDNSGKIAFSEFLILWSYILAWKVSL